MVRRNLDFTWNLRQLMAAHQMWQTTALSPLLRERGIDLSPAQVYRLVSDKPERLSMKVLVALCDIFDCTPSDLITPHVVVQQRKNVAGQDADVVEMPREFRPERARITDEDR